LQQAGLSAGDVVIAVDGLKLNLAQLEKRLLHAAVGEVWRLHAFRRDELNQFEISLQVAQADSFLLGVADTELARRGWLGV
jgi:predicted metalloprotease with PDZ domain